MKKFAAFIVKYRLIILGLILLATIACTFAMFYVNVNSDILSYLPDGMEMTEGLDFMQENFNMQGDAIIGIRGEGLTYEWMQQYTSDLAAKYSAGDDPVIKPGGVIWYGMIKDMASVDDGGMGSMIDDYIKDYGLTFEKLMEIAQSMAENPEIEQMFHPDDQTYLIMLQLSAPSSSDEAMDLLDHIEKTVTPRPARPTRLWTFWTTSRRPSRMRATTSRSAAAARSRATCSKARSARSPNISLSASW